jgi:hypothetical protein
MWLACPAFTADAALAFTARAAFEARCAARTAFVRDAAIA